MERWLAQMGRSKELTSEQVFSFTYKLIDADDTWQVLDVINFFKFITDNQGNKEVKIYGQIDPLHLWRIHAVYQLERIKFQEMLYEEKKQQYITGSSERSSNATDTITLKDFLRKGKT